MKQRRQWMLLLSGCLLLFSFRPEQRDPVPGKPTPTPIEGQLSTLRQKDDLSGWIYCQLQWVAKSPLSRVAILTGVEEKAWRAPRSNEEIQAWLDLLVNKGYALLLSGDIVRSTDSYTAAFQWARQHAALMDETIVLDNILKPLGNNYTRLGDYEQALFIHRKALAIALSIGDKNALAGTYSNLANTASNMGDLAQSLLYCKEGLALVKEAPALRGLLLSEQADAFMAAGQTTAASESIRQSIETLKGLHFTGKEGPEPGYWLLTAYQQAGDIYAQEPVTALVYYQKALALEKVLSDAGNPLQKRQQAKLYQRLADLYARIQQPATAKHWLEQCIAVLVPHRPLDSLQASDLYGENTLMDGLFTAAGLAAGEKKSDKALGFYRLCFTTEKILQQELITGSSRERSVAEIRMRYETAIGAAWDVWQRTGSDTYRQTMLEFMESSKSQLLLDELLQQRSYRHNGAPSDSLENRIRLLEKALIYYKKEDVQQTGKKDGALPSNTAQEKQIEWDLSQLRKKVRTQESTAVFSYGELSRLLQNDHQLIRSFFAGPRALYFVEAGRDGIHFAEKLDLPPNWQDSLQSFTHTWFEQGAGHMINQPAEYYRQAYEIYRELFAAHPLQTGKEYILLPDGGLNLLPIEALVTQPDCPSSPERWPYVIRQIFLSYAWSLRTLKEQELSPGNKDGVAGFFVTGDIRQLPLLQAIGKERKGIAQLIPRGSWYVDQQATTPAFRGALQNSAIVHISSHAFSGKDSSGTPCIELYNEPFYLFELKDLERHPSLVVLSACRTGDGKMITGEGVQSLARAFTAGGSNAVVAGWWNVNDAAAAQIMEDFYRQLLSGSEMAQGAASLRLSKLQWLGDPTISYLQKLPYYWAALNYSGAPGLPPMDTVIKGGNSLPGIRPLLIAVCMLIVLFIGVGVLRRRR